MKLQARVFYKKSSRAIASFTPTVSPLQQASILPLGFHQSLDHLAYILSTQPRSLYGFRFHQGFSKTFYDLRGFVLILPNND